MDGSGTVRGVRGYSDMGGGIAVAIHGWSIGGEGGGYSSGYPWMPCTGIL